VREKHFFGSGFLSRMSEIKVGRLLTVTNLGRILDNPNFNTVKYVFPLGFTAERRYFSYKNLSEVRNHQRY
jgi:hypothetical protein